MAWLSRTPPLVLVTALLASDHVCLSTLCCMLSSWLPTLCLTTNSEKCFKKLCLRFVTKFRNLFTIFQNYLFSLKRGGRSCTVAEPKLEKNSCRLCLYQSSPMLNLLNNASKRSAFAGVIRFKNWAYSFE